MIDIKRVMAVLAGKRPIFHSEADFQHALAWEIHIQWPNSSMRLELPLDLDQRIHIDIWAADKDALVAIELKYKTRGLQMKVGKETYRLRNQSAQDQGRYDFVKDIWRLEQIVYGITDSVGYAIFLTNDSSYWKSPRTSRTVDADFRIHQGRFLKGELHWGPSASKGTRYRREEAIILENIYHLDWQDYSEPIKTSYGKFRYLLVKVREQLS